jgi:thioredoxin 1
MSTRIKHVTDTTFNREVLDSPIPVLVDYWAEWCGPCKMIGPALDESAESYADRLSVAKINVDENQSVPSRYHVRGIPTLMLFKNGEVVATKVGAVSKSQLSAFIDAHL